MPAVVEDSRTWRSASLSVVSAARREELLQVGEDRALERRAGEHLAGDEERDQRDREDATAGGCRRPSRRGRSGCPCRPSPRTGGAQIRSAASVQHGGQGSRCRAGLGGYRSGRTRIPPSKERPTTHGPTHLPPPAAGRRRRRSSRRVRQARSGQAAPPGWRVAARPSPTPRRPSAPAPSNYDAPGPPANTSTPVPAPAPVVAPEPGRSEPVEEQALQADDTAAVTDAIADAAAAARRRQAEPGARPCGAVDAPSQLTPEPVASTERAVAVRRRRSPEPSRRQRCGGRPRHRGCAVRAGRGDRRGGPAAAP